MNFSPLLGMQQANYVNTALHPTASPNRVPTLIFWSKGGNFTSTVSSHTACEFL